jgi:membrane-bound lytic murein transglycosylase B
MTRNFTITQTIRILLLPAIFSLILFGRVSAVETDRDDVQSFMNELITEHGFETDYLQSMLGGADTHQSILDAISRPAERTKPWHEYRKIFVTRKRIAGGVEFWSAHREKLARIAAETGVPEEIMVAIVGVETYYGTRTGSYRVVDALATLGFDYPPRAKFFRSELMEVFLLARDESLDLDSIKGSYAGAMGAPQFIPSSYRHYAVDGDGDGRRDLFDNWDDILSSVANYFVAHKWKSGAPVVTSSTIEPGVHPVTVRNQLKLSSNVAELNSRGFSFDTSLDNNEPAELISLEGEDEREYWIGFHNFYVITRYNRSVMYALAVSQLGEAVAAAYADANQAASQ